MENLNLEPIESLGQLLAYYQSDLEYIANFKLFLNNKKEVDDYLTCKKGFQEFINEFRIARNIKKQKVKELILFIKNSKLLENVNAVDAFAEEMKNNRLTHEDKIMTVLASKIFFLNKPDKIIPMDSLNKKSLGIKGNKYKDFKIKVDGFIVENRNTIASHIKSIIHLLTEIENNVNVKINFEAYRINRFTDKYLWTQGKNKTK